MAPKQQEPYATSEAEKFLVDEGSGLALMVGDDGALLATDHGYNIPLNLRKCLAFSQRSQWKCTKYVEEKNHDWIVECIARWKGRADAAEHDTFFEDVETLMRAACCWSHRGNPHWGSQFDIWKLAILQNLGRNYIDDSASDASSLASDKETGYAAFMSSPEPGVEGDDTTPISFPDPDPYQDLDTLSGDGISPAQDDDGSLDGQGHGNINLDDTRSSTVNEDPNPHQPDQLLGSGLLDIPGFGKLVGPYTTKAQQRRGATAWLRAIDRAWEIKDGKKNVAPRELEPGFVYIFRLGDDHRFLKIGLTKRSFSARLNDSNNCWKGKAIEIYPAKTVGPGDSFLYAGRVEQVVLALFAKRRLSVGGCYGKKGRCNTTHVEWITASQSADSNEQYESVLRLARERIERWSQWAKSMPYDENGGLTVSGFVNAVNLFLKFELRHFDDEPGVLDLIHHLGVELGINGGASGEDGDSREQFMNDTGDTPEESARVDIKGGKEPNAASATQHQKPHMAGRPDLPRGKPLNSQLEADKSQSDAVPQHAPGSVDQNPPSDVGATQPEGSDETQPHSPSSPPDTSVQEPSLHKLKDQAQEILAYKTKKVMKEVKQGMGQGTAVCKAWWRRHRAGQDDDHVKDAAGLQADVIALLKADISANVARLRANRAARRGPGISGGDVEGGSEAGDGTSGTGEKDVSKILERIADVFDDISSLLRSRSDSSGGNGPI